MANSRRIAKNTQKKRLDNVLRNAQLMSELLSLGFKTLQAFKEIFRVYYPDIEESEVKRLWDIRATKSELLDKFENVVNRLKKS